MIWFTINLQNSLFFSPILWFLGLWILIWEQCNEIIIILCFEFYYRSVVMLWEISPPRVKDCATRIPTSSGAKCDKKQLHFLWETALFPFLVTFRRALCRKGSCFNFIHYRGRIFCKSLCQISPPGSWNSCSTIILHWERNLSQHHHTSIIKFKTS